MDITEILKNLRRGNKGTLESEGLLQELVEKIDQRKEELAQMRQTESSKFRDTQEELDGFDIDAPETLTNFKDLGLYNFDKEGNSPEKEVQKLDGQNKDEDYYQI